MILAVEKGEEKLRKYYSKTSDEQGFIFNLATILDPKQKLSAYDVRIITAYYHSLILIVYAGRDVGTIRQENVPHPVPAIPRSI